MIGFNVKIDMSGLQKAIVKYAATTKKSPVEIVNQRTLNVARWAFESLPPKDVASKRKEIKAYMDTVITTAIRLVKKTGKFKARGAKHHLRRKNLIVQANRGRAGLPGLYGAAMRAASGTFGAFAQTSVGYVKSVFLPVFAGLNPYVKFKMPFSKTNNIARWPGSSGSGKVTPAKEGWDVHAMIETSTGTQQPGQIEKIAAMQSEAVQFGIDKEERLLRAHVAKKLKQDASKFATVK